MHNGGAVYIFPSVKGCQAQRDCYVSMVPISIATQIFLINDDNIPVETVKQRVFNDSSASKIKDYLLHNVDNYFLSSLSVSVNAKVLFIPAKEETPLIGSLKIPMTAQFLVNDGRHRTIALTNAIKENRKLGRDHISVVFYEDEGFEKAKKMYSDLSKSARIKNIRIKNV